MKKEPCIKLGMRIRPKIREKPDDNRNNSPPSARLLAARIAACAELIGVNIERSFSSQTGRKLAPTRRTSGKTIPPRAQRNSLSPPELGFTRVRPLNDMAEVGNIRLRLGRGSRPCLWHCSAFQGR